MSDNEDGRSHDDIDLLVAAGSGVGMVDQDTGSSPYNERDFTNASGYYHRDHHAFFNAVYHNDPSITEVHTASLPRRRGDCRQPLGLALSHNTHVVSLQFDLQSVYEENRRFGSENSNRVLAFIRESLVLRSVKIDGLYAPMFGSTGEYAWLLNLFLQAIADNPRLKYVRLHRCENMPSSAAEAIIRLLQTTEALTCLELSGCFFEARSTTDLLFSHAIRANQTLESLVVHGHTALWDDFSLNLLQQLASREKDDDDRPLSLKHLTLVPLFVMTTEIHNTSRLVDVALHTFLTKSPLYALESLHLYHRFNREGMELFVDALRTNTTLTTLNMEDCMLDDDALSLFLQHMQDPTTVQTNLTFTSSGTFDYGSLTQGDVAAGIVMGPLQSLRINNDNVNDDGVIHLDGLFNCLAATTTTTQQDASSICLNRLEVDVISSADNVHSFVRCLPELVHLRTLRVTALNLNVWQVAVWDANATTSQPRLLPAVVDSQSVVNALRQNGSLYSVHIAGQGLVDDDDPFLPLFTPRQHELIDSFVQRNEQLPLLLAHPNIESDQEDDENVNANANAMDDDAADNNESITSGGTDKKQFPTLFCAAQQAPRTSPNSLLSGLVALSESLQHPIPAAARSDDPIPADAVLDETAMANLSAQQQQALVRRLQQELRQSREMITRLQVENRQLVEMREQQEAEHRLELARLQEELR